MVDRFYIDEFLSPNQEITSTYTGQDSTHHDVNITLTLTVVCAENYYGADCSVFCKAKDDFTGHYTCDEDGEKVCLEGFTNPGSNCVQSKLKNISNHDYQSLTYIQLTLANQCVILKVAAVTLLGIVYAT